MKESKITPGLNLLFSASRMILPEHRELFLEQRNSLKKKVKPELDEQKLEELSYVIQESIVNNKQVRIIVFGEFEDKEYEGVITKIDPAQRRIKLGFDEYYEWINLDDMVDIFFV